MSAKAQRVDAAYENGQAQSGSPTTTAHPDDLTQMISPTTARQTPYSMERMHPASTIQFSTARLSPSPDGNSQSHSTPSARIPPRSDDPPHSPLLPPLYLEHVPTLSAKVSSLTKARQLTVSGEFQDILWQPPRNLNGRRQDLLLILPEIIPLSKDGEQGPERIRVRRLGQGSRPHHDTSIRG